jgi:hypothetical protein
MRLVKRLTGGSNPGDEASRSRCRNAGIWGPDGDPARGGATLPFDSKSLFNMMDSTMDFRSHLRSHLVTMAALLGILFTTPMASAAETPGEFVVLGPILAFEGEGPPDLKEFRETCFDADLLSHVGGEAGIEASGGSVVEFSGKELKWIPGRSSDSVIDLEKTLGRHEWSVAYAYAEVDSEEAKRVMLGLGSDDSVRVWLNGELVLSRSSLGPPRF